MQRIQNEPDHLERIEGNAHRNQQPEQIIRIEIQNLLRKKVGILVIRQRQQLQWDQHEQIFPAPRSRWRRVQLRPA